MALLTVPIHAQRSQQTNIEIQVRVTYEDDRPAGQQIKIDLTNASGIPISQAFTDTSGRAIFSVSSPGIYLVRASGTDIKETASESVEVDPMDHMRVVFLRVKRISGTAQSASTSSNAQVTSAAQLRVPQDARKAFDKGMAAWQKQNFQQAANEFEKAVAAYPEYDTAYNNLGVMYAHLSQTDKAVAAFTRSVELNDKNADADRNLARMMMRQKDYPQAEELLKKSLTVQPLDASTLTMLAIAEIEDGKVDEALRDAQKVHELPHEGYAVAHYVAGEALEEKHEYQKASAEYLTYLRESPNGPDAAEVKSALARLSASTTVAAPKAK